MRRKIIIAVSLLPTTLAISLSNFQRITSTRVLKTCEDAYNREIPFCSQVDFIDSCSPHCIRGLYSAAEEVSGACEDISGVANTLLGIVLGGGIINVLCPPPKSKFSKTATVVISFSKSIYTMSSVSDSSMTTTSKEISSTETLSMESTSDQSYEPTTLFLTTQTSQTPMSGPKITTPHSTISPSVVSPTIIPTSPTITTSVASLTSNDDGTDTSTKILSSQTSLQSSSQSNPPSSSQSSSQSSSSSQPADPKTNLPSDESGGGSPFDNQNFLSGATSSDKTSFCAMAIALIWACIIQR